MTKTDIVIWAAIIFGSDMAAAVIFYIVQGWWEKKKNKALDINCDNCEEAKPLNRTPNKVAWLCRLCMKAFFADKEGDFTPEQISKAMKGYRRRKKSRGRR